MTTKEMIDEFYVLLDEISKEFETIERPNTYIALKFLNISQTRYLKEVFFQGSVFNVAQDKADEIEPLIKRELVTTSLVSTGPYANRLSSYTISGLSETFMFYIRSDSQVSRTVINTCTDKWVPNEFISHSKISKFKPNFYNKNIILKPKVFFEEGKILILYDEYTTHGTTNSLSVEYIREPLDLTSTQDSELPIHMHEPLVKFAVNSYIDEYKFKINSLQKQQ